MKLIYVENIRLPTEKAHGYQIMKTLDAIHRAGVDAELVIAERKNPLGEKDPFEYYRVSSRFPITRLPVIGGLTSAPAPLKRFAYALERWSFHHGIRRACRGWNADVLYTREVEIAETLAECLPRTPVFVELHDDPRMDGGQWARLASAVSGWIVISDGLRRTLAEKGIDPKKIRVSPDAFDEEEFSRLPSRDEARRSLGIPEGQFLFVYTGHLFPWKGMDAIAPAFASLPRDCELAVVGGYPEDVARVKRLAGDSPRVRWLGHVPRDDAHRWLAAADAAVLPTSATFEIGRSFTSPLKLFEYLAAGLPIIASDLPSSREILDETTAVFFRADDAQDFLRAISSLMSQSNEERKHISDNSRAIGSSFTWTHRGKDIQNFLEHIVHRV